MKSQLNILYLYFNINKQKPNQPTEKQKMHSLFTNELIFAFVYGFVCVSLVKIASI